MLFTLSLPKGFEKSKSFKHRHCWPTTKNFWCIFKIQMQAGYQHFAFQLFLHLLRKAFLLCGHDPCEVRVWVLLAVRRRLFFQEGLQRPWEQDQSSSQVWRECRERKWWLWVSMSHLVPMRMKTEVCALFFAFASDFLGGLNRVDIVWEWMKRNDGRVVAVKFQTHHLSGLQIRIQPLPLHSSVPPGKVGPSASPWWVSAILFLP